MLENTLTPLYGVNMRRFTLNLLIGLSMLIPLSAAADARTEQLIAQTTARLQSYFEQQEKSENPSFYDVAIAKERETAQSLHAALLEELTTLPSTTPEGAPLETTPLEKEQALVKLVTERLSEAKVDLDLLQKEKSLLYEGAPQPEGEGKRLTQSFAELKAKSAVLEEQIAAMQKFLPPHEERLSKLRTEQRIEQFSSVFTLGKYLGLILIVILIERFLRLRLLPQFIQDQGARYAAGKVLAAVVYVSLAIVVIARLSADYPGTLTSFAIIGAALAVALQDVVKDFLSWILIAQSNRFGLGDRISVGQWTGDVIDISPLRTTLLEVATEQNRDIGRTGKVLTIPNSMMLSQPAINYNTTSDFLRIELHVLITLQSDRKEAVAIAKNVLEEETGNFTETARLQERLRMRRFYVAEINHDPSVYVELATSGILLMLRFYAPVSHYRTIKTAITEKLLDRFAASGIDIAYPTSRAYATTLELGQRVPGTHVQNRDA